MNRLDFFKACGKGIIGFGALLLAPLKWPKAEAVWGNTANDALVVDKIHGRTVSVWIADEDIKAGEWGQATYRPLDPKTLDEVISRHKEKMDLAYSEVVQPKVLIGTTDQIERGRRVIEASGGPR